MRNCRGLKPSQCARLEGHHHLARLLHKSGSSCPPFHCCPSHQRKVQSMLCARGTVHLLHGTVQRRPACVRQGHLKDSRTPSQGVGVRCSAPTALGRRRGGRGVRHLAAGAPTLEALMHMLVARAKLLLSLRLADSSLQVPPPPPPPPPKPPRTVQVRGRAALLMLTATCSSDRGRMQAVCAVKAITAEALPMLDLLQALQHSAACSGPLSTAPPLFLRDLRRLASTSRCRAKRWQRGRGSRRGVCLPPVRQLAGWRQGGPRCRPWTCCSCWRPCRSRTLQHILSPTLISPKVAVSAPGAQSCSVLCMPKPEAAQWLYRRSMQL